MGQRGRKSAQELTKPPSVKAIDRPDAPYDLTDEQAEEWWAVVNRMPADWFPREMHPLLTAYCCHVVERRHIGQLLTALKGSKDFSTEDYDRLLKMQERETRALASLATRMRLTQQSTYDARKGKGEGPKRDWEINRR